MFNIGLSELLLIAVVALVFIGPKELPVVMRQVVKFFRELQRLGDDVRKQVDDVVRESGLDTSTIIDLEGKPQQAYDVKDLEALSARKPAPPAGEGEKHD